MTPEQMDRLQKGTNEFGSIIGGRWPGGKIPYVIESSISKCHLQLSSAGITRANFVGRFLKCSKQTQAKNRLNANTSPILKNL